MKNLIALSSLLFLSACFSDDPGTQCLNSFKSSLKDPDSGKVLDFTPPTLTYSATNSYGARVQGKALCKQHDKKWSRDFQEENMAVMQRSIDKLDENKACRDRKGSYKACESETNSLAIRHNLSEKELNEESRRELGFN